MPDICNALQFYPWVAITLHYGGISPRCQMGDWEEDCAICSSLLHRSAAGHEVLGQSSSCLLGKLTTLHLRARHWFLYMPGKLGQ